MELLNKEIEVVQLSIYCEIIEEILSEYKNMSIIKVCYFSYILKTNKINDITIYDGKTSKDVLDKAISLLNGDFEKFCNDIEFIIKAMHLLNKAHRLKFQNSEVEFFAGNKIKKVYLKDNLFINNAIVLSKEMSDKQFMKELLRCV